MNSPWEILGVIPGCSLTALKQAYAKLLKQHRPDKDPEGSRRIRSAYEFLRANESLPDASSAPNTKQESPMPQERVLEALSQRVLESPQDNAPPPSNQTRESEELPQEQRRKASPVADASPRSLTNLQYAVEFARREQWPEAFDRLDEIKRELERAPSPELAAALVQGAELIALVNWNYAQFLGSVAYPHLEITNRGAVLDVLETLVQSAKELQSVPARERSVLCRCLAANSANPNEPAVRHAVQAMCDLALASTAQNYFMKRFPHFKRSLSQSVDAENSQKSHGCGVLIVIVVALIFILSCYGLVALCLHLINIAS